MKRVESSIFHHTKILLKVGGLSLCESVRLSVSSIYFHSFEDWELRFSTKLTEGIFEFFQDSKLWALRGPSLCQTWSNGLSLWLFNPKPFGLSHILVHWIPQKLCRYPPRRGRRGSVQEMGSDLTQACFWTVVSKGLTHLWSELIHVLFDPSRIDFFLILDFGFLGEIYKSTPKQKMADPIWPNLSNKKIDPTRQTDQSKSQLKSFQWGGQRVMVSSQCTSRQSLT